MTAKERLELPVMEMGRTDIRAYIKKRLKEEGIPILALATSLDVAYSNLKTALRGEIPLPLERIETILWILDGEDSL